MQTNTLLSCLFSKFWTIDSKLTIYSDNLSNKEVRTITDALLNFCAPFIVDEQMKLFKNNFPP